MSFAADATENVNQASTTPTQIVPAWLPFYYGWIQVVLAAVAMTATLPGRTHGLGLITQPLLADLGLTEDDYARYNFWAILLGSLLCLPTGRLLDRIGARAVLTGVAAALGAVVLLTARVRPGQSVALFVLLALTRGLGQGALSVVSMALVGKWFTRRLGPAMGVYTVLLAIGFIVPVVVVGEAVQRSGDWRGPWAAVGLCLLAGLAPLGWLLGRDSPEACGLAPDGVPAVQGGSPLLALSLSAALRSPAFWTFTLATSLFNLVWSALTLFNQAILEARGYGKDTYTLVMAVLVFSGLPSSIVTGWLARRWPLGRLLGIGMVLLALSLAIFPHLFTTGHLIAYAAVLGVAGGIITVIFFSVYGHAFGRAHLGAIQATVQVVTILASASGPWLLTTAGNPVDGYDRFFYCAAPAALLLGLAVWLTPLPRSSNSATPSA